MCYGSDVMTRLVAASDSAELARAMSRQAVEAIGEALLDIAVREGIDIEQVVGLTLVGNTAMLALLSGRNYDLLLEPSHWTSPVDCLPDRPDLWTDSLGVHPQARIEVIPPLAGFVGSDLLAGVLRTHLTEDVPGCLLIDFGTNSEIALWDGRVLRVTSAAGGPAFEGNGVSCGAPAEPGAIYRVSLRNGALDYAVIVRSGRLTCRGQFAPHGPPGEVILGRGEQALVLTKKDVDVFQRAKAAIGAGTQALMTQAAMEYGDLRRIRVGGSFGRFLDVGHAQEIGLLPRIPVERVELCGNTALAGCAEALLSSVAVQRLKDLRDQTQILGLSRWPGLDDLFLTHLHLQPMRGE
jgi:uncharacterized 2Fe-2S/4Fe-4S cluster protein (DUF4445 family)